MISRFIMGDTLAVLNKAATELVNHTNAYYEFPYRKSLLMYFPSAPYRIKNDTCAVKGTNQRR
jgi:hypothetical protein